MDRYKFKNRRFPKEFKRVADYILALKNIKVSLGHTTEFTGHFNRQIFIHHNYDLRKNGLIALLHECGHVMQPPTNIGVNAYKNLDEAEYPNNYKLGRFMKEVDAWNQGIEIANELGIQPNPKMWESEKKKALLTYFE